MVQGARARRHNHGPLRASEVSHLKEAGCHKIYIDKASGAKSARPGLEKCLEEIGPADTLMVTRLDRLGRTMPHLVKLTNDLKTMNIAFRSLGDGDLNTSTASGVSGDTQSVQPVDTSKCTTPWAEKS